MNEILKKVLLDVTKDQITIIGSDLKMSVTSNLRSGFQSDDKDLGKYLVDPGMFVQLLKELLDLLKILIWILIRILH